MLMMMVEEDVILHILPKNIACQFIPYQLEKVVGIIFISVKVINY